MGSGDFVYPPLERTPFRIGEGLAVIGLLRIEMVLSARAAIISVIVHPLGHRRGFGPSDHVIRRTLRSPNSLITAASQ
jgi:hypothetical protein